MSLTITGIAFSLIFLLSDRFTLPAGIIGLFLAVGYGAYMTGCALFKRVEAVISPRLCLPLSVAIMTASVLLLWFSTSPWIALLAWVLFQFTTGFYWPPLMGWLARDLCDRELNRDLGRFNQSWSVGALIGPVTAGFLYSRSALSAFSFNVISMVVLLLLLILGVTFLKDMKYNSNSEQNENGDETRIIKSTGTFLRFPSWIGLFCSYAFLGVVLNILPLEIRNQLGYTEQTAGNLLFVRGIASLVGFSILGKTLKWHYNKGWFIITQTAVILLPLLLLPFSFPLPGYILGLTLFGLLFSTSYSNSIFHGCAGVENRGGRMAIHEGILTAGAAFGSFAGGMLYQKGGITGAVVFLIILQATGLLLSLILLKKHQSETG